ncbi:TlpA family protein disulfide reductase [Cohnella silvisoli]|uniref:TlpA disulfide reductase family protein n=1 Tax=Cohnella silvisoli TaxID=2873699 RepID=A0ABV1KL84_9BACL|nr:TlpA disulfide reductase family protein [Cohnella silvisoli]MCD9020783.1 TlpA family protein disulfide reductase [Cohnella silvisoli]
MNNNLRNWIIFSTVVLLTGLVLSQQIDRKSNHPSDSSVTAKVMRTENSESPKIGHTAPPFSLTGIDGKSYELIKMRPKPVILNFWASWCGPCQDEAATFVKLNKQFGDRIQILAINLTAADSVKSAQQFARTYGFTFPVLLDTDGRIAARYKIRAIPSTMFIDGQGIISDVVLGALSWDTLHNRALSLLKD